MVSDAEDRDMGWAAVPAAASRFSAAASLLRRRHNPTLPLLAACPLPSAPPPSTSSTRPPARPKPRAACARPNQRAWGATRGSASRMVSPACPALASRRNASQTANRRLQCCRLRIQREATDWASMASPSTLKTPSCEAWLSVLPGLAQD